MKFRGMAYHAIAWSARGFAYAAMKVEQEQGVVVLTDQSGFGNK